MATPMTAELASASDVQAPRESAGPQPRGTRQLGRLFGSTDSFTTLTPRERRILGLIADGLTNREIGDRLGVAEKTVKNHVTHILRKLRLRHRTEAALYAVSRALREVRPERDPPARSGEA